MYNSKDYTVDGNVKVTVDDLVWRNGGVIMYNNTAYNMTGMQVNPPQFDRVTEDDDIRVTQDDDIRST